MTDADVLTTAVPTGAAVAGPAPAAVELHGITKRFPGVIANDSVDLTVAAGEVHALLGENGAGKTTLSNILTGLYRPDSGEIRLHGEHVRFESPRDALEAGICMVHQHFRLVEPFTVAENIILGDRRGEGRRFRIQPRAVERIVRDLGERYGLPIDPHAHVWQLSLGEQQRVEIVNALYQGARVLILDEPTSVLTPQEAETLFVTLRRMTQEGRTVIFISHKLHEVMAVADRVTVLRSGRAVATVAAADATAQSLAGLMVGREVESVRRRTRDGRAGPVALTVEGLWADGDRGLPAVQGVSLSLQAGEIVAIAGVSGNGQRELAETIAGLRRPTRGSIRVGDRGLKGGDPRDAIGAGVAYVPEDRLGTGVASGLSIAMNLALKTYRRDSTGPLLHLARMRDRTIETIRRYEIKAPGPDATAGQLSGGNLQKVVLARELESLASPSVRRSSPRRGGGKAWPASTLSGEPKVLIAASATRGLDVAAIEAVHRYLVEAADSGVAVLLISEDLDEVLALNDRILVMYEGRISEVRHRASVEEIGLLMAGDAAEPA